jgi:hypothetical protein
MGKPRKNRALRAPQIALTASWRGADGGIPDVITHEDCIVRFPDQKRAFDFWYCAKGSTNRPGPVIRLGEQRPELAYELARGFMCFGVNKVLKYRALIYRSICLWLRWLIKEDEYTSVMSLHNITVQLLEEYRTYVERVIENIQTRKNSWAFSSSFLQFLIDQKSPLVNPSLLIPKAGWKSIDRTGGPSLSDADLQIIIERCLLVIKQAWNTFQDGRCLIADRADMPDAMLLTHDLGNVLTYVHRHHGGIWPGEKHGKWMSSAVRTLHQRGYHVSEAVR